MSEEKKLRKQRIKDNKAEGKRIKSELKLRAKALDSLFSDLKSAESPEVQEGVLVLIKNKISAPI